VFHGITIPKYGYISLILVVPAVTFNIAADLAGMAAAAHFLVLHFSTFVFLRFRSGDYDLLSFFSCKQGTLVINLSNFCVQKFF